MKTSLKKLTRILIPVAVVAITGSLAQAQAPFTEVADTGDLGQTISDNWGASWGDYDGDGDIDLFLGNILQAGNIVFRNDGNGRFTRMTRVEIGELADDVSDTAIALWADMDNDGDLDIYVANYSEALENADWGNFDTPAQADRLYVNDGSGMFAQMDMPNLSGTLAYSVSINPVDYDADGLLDIFIGTWPIVSGFSGPDVLWHNEGSLSFSQAEFPSYRTRSYGSSWVDYDGDGDLDALVNTWRQGYPPVFYRNLGDQASSLFEVTSTFANGQSLGVRSSHHAWGDYDNDGDLDLYIQNGYPTDSTFGGCDLWTNLGGGNFERRSFFSDQDPGSSAATWIDTDNDGNLDLLAHVWRRVGEEVEEDGYLLFKGDGNGGFIAARLLDAAPDGVDRRSPVVGDFNNDGFMDVLSPHFSDSGQSAELARDRLFQNDGNPNHWLKLVLKGTVSNGSAIGAIIRLKATIGGIETWQMRQIMAGDGGPWVQHDMRPNFGLGDANVAEVVRIEWPSGVVQELMDVNADQILTVVEPVRLYAQAPERLSWYSSKALTVELEGAPNASGPWSPATETVEANGTLRTTTIENDAASHFYRLRGVRPAPIPAISNPDPERLVRIPVGTFMMGSPESESEREALVATTGYGDETQHEVTLTQSFWMAKRETTQREYDDIMGSNPSVSQGGPLPVDSVTWHEAVEFCEKLTEQEQAEGRLPEGYVYRLPTEAEWEHACRARTTTAFYFGDELRSRDANFDGTHEYSVSEGGTVENAVGLKIGRPTPAEHPLFEPNAWGLYDLHGNVSEWCADRIDHYPNGPVTNPVTPEPSEEQGAVLRGGSWDDPGTACRSANRDFQAPSVRDSRYGFRVVLARPLDRSQ